MIPVGIFLIKLIEYIIETFRVSGIANKKRYQASVCAFIEVLIWALVFKLAFLDAPFGSVAFFLRVGAYALGSALGTWIGVRK